MICNICWDKAHLLRANTDKSQFDVYMRLINNHCVINKNKNIKMLNIEIVKIVNQCKQDIQYYKDALITDPVGMVKESTCLSKKIWDLAVVGDWNLEWNDELQEFQATHEDYDGAPDGNRHLFCHDYDLFELLDEILEVQQ